MNTILPPRLVVLTGIPGAGRSTICRELAKKITNAFHMSRDMILYDGLLLVSHTPVKNLISFEEYVAHDKVFPNDAEVIETAFGPMTRVHHVAGSDFYVRHGQEQSILIQERIALEGLSVGKVPILDGFQARHISSGKMKKFLSQEKFASYPKKLIQVVVDENECFKRHTDRAQTSRELALRAKYGYLDRENFHAIMEKNHPQVPEGLKEIPHHFLDTTGRTIEDCVNECLEYIKS